MYLCSLKKMAIALLCKRLNKLEPCCEEAINLGQELPRTERIGKEKEGRLQIMRKN